MTDKQPASTSESAGLSTARRAGRLSRTAADGAVGGATSPVVLAAPLRAPPAYLEQACDQFEAEWRAGRHPRIEDFLGRAAIADRPLFLRELLLCERAYRQALQTLPCEDEYLARFPEDTEVVHQVFLEPSEATRAEPGPPSFSVPQVLGDYRILKRIGKGGMALVFKAEHVRLKRIVAIKVLNPCLVGEGEFLHRFLREMQAVGRLDHPHVVRCTDAREEAGLPFLVMDYIEGENLEKIIQRHKRLAIADACEIVRQAADGLQHAHEHGMVHRDIKPSNLMLDTTGTIKVLDFGLARLCDSMSLTVSSQMMGTFDYMAPEQARRAAEADIRADLYSLACTLYHFLAGSPPYGDPDHATPASKLAAHLQEPFPSLQDKRPDAPKELAFLLSRLAAKNPADRPANPREVAEAIRPLCSGADLIALLGSERERRPDEGSAPQPPKPRDPGKWRQRTLAGLLIACIACVGSLVWWLAAEKKPDAVVDNAMVFVRRDADDRLIERLTIDKNGTSANRSLSPLGLNDDFKLKVAFSRGTYWYLVWRDTNGVAQLVAHAETAQSTAEYPPGNQFISVAPEDPAGLHLLLLLVSDRPPADIEKALQQSLADFGTVAAPPAGQYLQFRGPGSPRAGPENIDPENASRFESRLPPGVNWALQFYLPTRR